MEAAPCSKPVPFVGRAFLRTFLLCRLLFALDVWLTKCQQQLVVGFGPVAAGEFGSLSMLPGVCPELWPDLSSPRAAWTIMRSLRGAAPRLEISTMMAACDMVVTNNNGPVRLLLTQTAQRATG